MEFDERIRQETKVGVRNLLCVGAHNSGNKTMEEDMHPDGSGAACQSSQKIC
jgi:hypothetical protein